MSKAQNIIEFMQYSEGLKTELRSFTLSNGSRKESTAEHSWRLALFVMLVEPELTIKVDINKAIRIAIAHDVVEIEAGDISYMKHFGNEDLKTAKERNERLAMDNIKKKFGSLGSLIEGLWLEYEEQKTPESKLIKALDKLEARLQYILDPIYTFDEEESANIPGVIDNTRKLCSIDPFLAELEKEAFDRRLIKEELSKSSN